MSQVQSENGNVSLEKGQETKCLSLKIARTSLCFVTVGGKSLSVLVVLQNSLLNRF